jgi:hypothetical protein
MVIRLPDGAVNRARAVFAAVGPVPDDAVILRAIEAALRKPDVAPRVTRPRKSLPPGTPLRYLTRAQIMRVTCPECHAGSAKPCRQGQQVRGRVHIERLEKALRELPEQAGESGRAAFFAANP